MKVKMILPALTEAKSPFWRPIKYSLFPPLGLATLAAYLSENDEVDLQDEHVETLTLDDDPDLVVIQVYITSAYRAYEVADHYRRKGAYVALGGLHVIHTPGHTPGSICLWAPRHRLLFTGDVLQVRWGRLTYASAFFSHDYPAARAAVARLATLDVETIALAHYGLWRRDAHERLRALAAAAG